MTDKAIEDLQKRLAPHDVRIRIDANATVIKGLPHTVVKNIVIKVQADPNRAQQFLQKIDWEVLKKLIKN